MKKILDLIKKHPDITLSISVYGIILVGVKIHAFSSNFKTGAA